MGWGANILQNLPLALNSTFGSIIVIILILLTYIRMYSIDRFRRNTFCLLLAFCLASMIFDFTHMLMLEIPGSAAYTLRYLSGTLHSLFQVLSCYYIMIFIDYMIFERRYRSDKILKFTYAVIITYAIIFIIGYILLDQAVNEIINYIHFYLRIIIGYGPIVFAIGVLIKNRSLLKKNEFVILSVLLVFFIIGTGFCFLFSISYMIWPFETTALLYTYFFIIQSHASMDPLTKTGNRLSFNEFTDRLSRFASGESWAVVMIDMDHFKQINDTLGHQEGDHALGYMAEIINSCIRKNDFVARYGGDEFVLAAKVEKDTADETIKKLMSEIQFVIKIFNDKEICPFKLEISYGYDIYTADGSKSMKDFMSHIDTLMYKHKNERRRSSDKQEAS